MYKCYICRQKYLIRKIDVSPNIEVLRYLNNLKLYK